MLDYSTLALNQKPNIMLKKTNLKEIASLFTEDLWDKGNLSIADDIFQQHFTDHDPVQGQGPNVEGYKQMIAGFKSAFPDLRVRNEDVIEDERENKVVVRWTAQGTHTGELMQIPATGKKVSLRGVDILRVEDGKIVERWGEFDALGMLAQLGVIQL
ncbi:MAG: ester cyclase [Saprospiraceae bacterium]